MTLSPHLSSVGIDVGKCEVFVAIHGCNSATRSANSAQGHQVLQNLLSEMGGDLRVGLEATGGYEAPLWEALHAAGHHVRPLSPARIKAFAKMRGTQAKTDPIDAATVAGYLALNRDIKRFADGLKARNLPCKKFITTVARKLMELANTILKRGTPWQNRNA